MDEWKTNNTPAAFRTAKQHLAETKVTLERLPTERAYRLAELNSPGRQLKRFLESHRIEDAVLPNIGKARKQLLRVYNIEDASDVELLKLDIKGFGPTMRATLLGWRASVEQRFRFDPNKSVDPQDLQELEQEFQKKTADARRVLIEGQRRLMTTLKQGEAQTSKIEAAGKRLAQAEVNSNAFAKLDLEMGIPGNPDRHRIIWGPVLCMATGNPSSRAHTEARR